VVRGNIVIDFIIFTLCIVITINRIYKNRNILKELSKPQILGVGTTYLVTVSIAVICIYYGGNWITGQFSNIFVRYIIFLLVVCITLHFLINLLRNMLNNITKGVLPSNRRQFSS